jgi:GT2 family glycosyltransferase
MILLLHNGITVDEVCLVTNNITIDFNPNESIISVLKEVSITYPDDLLVWVKRDYKALLDYNEIESFFYHKCIMASYSVTGNYCISSRIGYVEQTPFTNVSRDVSFPTWLMSTDVGGIFTETFNRIIETVSSNKNPDYFLTSLAKHNMPLGLFCYSNPKFLKQNAEQKTIEKSSVLLLFKFVKQHYKSVWVFNLFVCYILFEKQLPVFPFLNALFYKRNKKKVYLDPLRFASTKPTITNKTIDVIIPTIGRKEHLFNVLKDLEKQTVLPKNVIIVEQVTNQSESSELDYLNSQVWSFKIIHKFLKNTGVCKARNMALKYIESDWCFFADDDIRIEPNLIENVFKTIEVLGVENLNLLCLQPHEKQSYFYVSQTDIFGSGSSIVKTSFLDKVVFDTSFEFGYGEDSDFGMQLRKVGADVIFIPTIRITHLKAPIGGFRTKHMIRWKSESIQPKPSPTLMIFIKKHYNSFQTVGYKYTLFLKFYKKQKVKNPIAYFKLMQKQWKQSEYCASKLIVDEN